MHEKVVRVYPARFRDSDKKSLKLSPYPFLKNALIVDLAKLSSLLPALADPPCV
jgi:hypothetical protein